MMARLPIKLISYIHLASSASLTKQSLGLGKLAEVVISWVGSSFPRDKWQGTETGAKLATNTLSFLIHDIKLGSLLT